MDFSAFDTKKIDEYTQQAKEQWGKTPEYQEFQQKAQSRTPQDDQKVMEDFMQLFVEFGEMKESAPQMDKAQHQVKKLQEYITEHFYKCSDEILLSLGEMYAGGGEFTANIDQMGGEGTAEFAAEAIRIYCGEK